MKMLWLRPVEIPHLNNLLFDKNYRRTYKITPTNSEHNFQNFYRFRLYYSDNE